MHFQNLKLDTDSTPMTIGLLLPTTPGSFGTAGSLDEEVLLIVQDLAGFNGKNVLLLMLSFRPQ
jgi:hypothetical protein